MINELRSITTFVRTAELGSLSKAAEAQQISPQAASKAAIRLSGIRTGRRMQLRRFLETNHNLTFLQDFSSP